MTLIELKELVEKLLTEYPCTTKLLLSKDSEGNAFRLMSKDFSPGVYNEDEESRWDLDFKSSYWSYEDAGYDSEEDWEEAKKDTNKICIVFWPIN